MGPRYGNTELAQKLLGLCVVITEALQEATHTA